MKHLSLFSMHNLALLSDWLDETGELFVDIYLHHGGGGYRDYFVRSMDDLKSVIAQETWNEIFVDVFRHPQYPLRGIADEKLLEQALQLVPDGYPYSTIELSLADYRLPVYEDYCGNTHEQLRQDCARVFGQEIGIGIHPTNIFYLDGKSPTERLNEIFSVQVRNDNQNSVVRKNQDYHVPYAEAPHRYQWLEALWNNDKSSP